jgi:aryl-alcohol dehydrogenase-like predicted oxidoreductase
MSDTWRIRFMPAELPELAARAGKKPVALALPWLAAQEAVDSIIIGASRMEQLEENLSAWDGELDEETRQACDRIWQRVQGDSFQYNR